jgi:hypothetical protein
MLPQNKMAKRFHVPDDTEIEELLEQKDAKNTKKSTASSVRCFRKYLEERGRETNFEDFVLTVLLTLMLQINSRSKRKCETFPCVIHVILLLFHFHKICSC